MTDNNRFYIAIDLKSFYASVECVKRGLDPLNTNLVVADITRTEKTICLAVTPSLKSYGIGGRARLYEVIQKVKEINNMRRFKVPYRRFTGKSVFGSELDKNSSLELDFIIARPQMAEYMRVSTEIFNIYQKYIAPEDIHVYSIDEVFIDVTAYLRAYKTTPRQLAVKIIKDIFETTGITATAGIGTNLYLCKVAMDIVAKKMPPDENGVRIAELDEMSYRKLLWSHTPITDFWRVGKGYAKRLESKGMFTMGDIARCSVYNEDVLYKLFGINARFLIDHAWGYEPCTIADIKAYKPVNNSISQGQVLSVPYNYEKAHLIIREMTELLVLDLVAKQVVTNQMVLTVGYDIESAKNYSGELVTDHYGRKIPKSAHSSINLKNYTSSGKIISEAVSELYHRIVDENLLVRRMSIAANHIIPENQVQTEAFYQLDFFTDYNTQQKQREAENRQLIRERNIQNAVLGIKSRYGKNAILKGFNLQEGATSIERNSQIGGHRA